MTQHSSKQADDKSAWSLPQWLTYLESIHTKNIDMGLDRIRPVFDDMAVDFGASTVVTVAGTNGKGTTCAVLEKMALTAGKSVLVYSSPHLLDYRERVRVNGQMLPESAYCEAFAYVDRVRGNTSLTYFEFGTLAAFKMAADAQCDLVLLEVGLGGRLDAVNLVDPDIGVITSVDLDHQDWLGDNREDIGREKAGIFRTNMPVVIGDPVPPQSVETIVQELGCQADWQNRDFHFTDHGTHWQWRNEQLTLSDLPIPAVPMQNVSTALAVLQRLPWALDGEQIKRVISGAQLPGRCQVWSDAPKVLLDVAHNPQAVTYLKQQLNKFEYRRLHLVVAMLGDKDMEASLAPLLDLEAHWYVAELDVPRGAKKEQIKRLLVGQQMVVDFASVSAALTDAKRHAAEHDLILVFGSFFTVAEVLSIPS